MLNKNNYYHVIQPIMNVVTELPVGFESLLRHRYNLSPIDLFHKARETGLLVDLDILSIYKFLNEQSNFDIQSKMFLNIFPSTIISAQFEKLLYYIQSNGLKNIVFEINESNDDKEVWRSQLFYEYLERAKEVGICIGIDDVGQGQATMQNIMRIEPHYIKLDKYFAEGLNDSKEKQQIVSSFIEMADSFNSTTVLEGIETAEDYEAAKVLGIPLVQGYFFGKPYEIEKRKITNE